MRIKALAVAGRTGVLLALAIAAGVSPAVIGAESNEVPREVGRLRSPELREISGLAASRRNAEVLWVHNDGGAKRVFAISTAGTLTGEVRIREKIDDIEDIAIGPGKEDGVDYVYVGDIGDNESTRRKVRLIRFPEPDVSGKREAKLRAEKVEVFELKYPDGPHDSEALMIDAVLGDVLIVTKEKDRSRLYVVAVSELRENVDNPLELVGYLSVDEVSGGDISASGNFVALRSEKRGWLWSRRPGEAVFAAMQRAPRIVLTRGRSQSENGESIGFHPKGRGYYTISEGPLEPIYIFPLPLDLRQTGG
ncbi:MAG TPA: hypothetical protein VGK58_03870 [Lacipirellulaceae bacterium]